MSSLEWNSKSKLNRQCLNRPRRPQERILRSPVCLTCSPNPRKCDALKAALLARDNHAVSQLLDNGMDPNIPIFRTHSSTETTALQWAAEQENLELVTLLLARSAHKTDRVVGTRALGQAVDRQNTAIVKVLLEHGVCCDFQLSDRPLPDPPWVGCTFGTHDESEPEEYAPPLVRAVKHDNLELARLLLAHGADANIGYHDLRWACSGHVEPWRQRERIHFSCGRVAQLAAELRRLEMVELLLDNGADIGLPQPVWGMPGHKHYCVPRSVYQRVTAGLRAAVAAKIAGKETT